jgi:VWFA-related protein
MLWAGSLLVAQSDTRTVFRTNVRMVAVPFTVTDNRGRPVSGLTAADVRIFENGAPQRIVALFEGDTAVLGADGGESAAAGANIFVLFDTSNSMYGVFPYVYDAIAEFVHRLDPADSVAIYTFSRNLARAAPLTSDHLRARAGLVNAVAGDDTALFNSILLTLRDAARVPGRKAVVVFSNGHDNASMVGPEEVLRVAQDEGIPVYMIATLNAARDRLTANAFQALTDGSGGKLYWTPRWEDQAGAFESVRQDIHSSYTAYYYPEDDSGAGYRQVRVTIAAAGGAKWRVRARAGYEARAAGTQARSSR